MAVEVQRRLFTVDEYHQMGQAGILGEDDRVELIEGEIVEMSPIGGRHVRCVNRANGLLSRGVGDRAVVSVQNPLRLSEGSEPQPDLVLLRPYVGSGGDAPPGAAEALLVVEVADTSTDFDCRVKLPLYARAGIPEAWLVDLPGDAIEVHRQPSREGYLEVHRLQRGQQLAPLAFPDITLLVDDLLA